LETRIESDEEELLALRSSPMHEVEEEIRQLIEERGFLTSSASPVKTEMKKLKRQGYIEKAAEKSAELSARNERKAQIERQLV